jgi:hypothetical protein
MKNNDSPPALISVCTKNNFIGLNMLLKSCIYQPCVLNAAFICACDFNSVNCVDILINNNNVDINQCNINKIIERRQYTIAYKIISCSNFMPKDSKSIIICAEKGYISLVKLLAINNYLKIFDCTEALIKAIRFNNYKISKIIVKNLQVDLLLTFKLTHFQVLKSFKMLKLFLLDSRFNYSINQCLLLIMAKNDLNSSSQFSPCLGLPQEITAAIIQNIIICEIFNSNIG